MMNLNYTVDRVDQSSMQHQLTVSLQLPPINPVPQQPQQQQVSDGNLEVHGQQQPLPSQQQPLQQQQQSMTQHPILTTLVPPPNPAVVVVAPTASHPVPHQPAPVHPTPSAQLPPPPQSTAKPSTSKSKAANADKGKNKRSRNPDNWLANVRKRQRQRGEVYVDRTGQLHRARRVGAGCGPTCRLRCEKLLSPEDRQKVHDQFWSLDDQQKWHFYAIYVERWNKARQRGKKTSPDSPSASDEKPRKQYSYVYFLQNKHGGRVRVCKTFFLSTLDINQKRLYFFYENVRTESGLPRAPLRGKVGTRATPETQVTQVRDHIRAFTRLPPPPGLTPQPGEEFLDAGISVRRMYELYRDSYGSMAVKENVYRKILKSDFNIKFIKPPTTT